MAEQLGILPRLARLYTFNSPIRKGKYRLALASLRLEEHLPKRLRIETIDGRSLKTNFNNDSAYFLYFLGEYEPEITKIIRSIVKPGFVCFDIGGNIGWYTTLLQQLVGKNGQVHSFEPVPATFEILQENVKSNANSEVVKLNNFALSESEGVVLMNVFDDLPDGHASMADFGRSEKRTFECPVRTLNSYMEQNAIDSVDFVKIDIEGAELMMLKGATRLFELEQLPVFEIEMALDTTRGFGYLPNDILEFFKAHGDFEYFAINEENGKLEPLKSFRNEDRGANVLCIPVKKQLRSV